MIQKFSKIINPRQRRKLFIMLVLMMIGMLFETLSVGLVVPIITTITNPDVSTQYPIFETLYDALDRPTSSQLIIGIAVIVISIFIIKGLYLTYMEWFKINFTMNLRADLSFRFFKYYLKQPYTFHLEHNSAELIQSNIKTIGHFAGAVMAVANLVSEILVLIGIVILLLLAEPLGAVIVTLNLSFVLYVYQYFTKHRTPRWGKQRLVHEEKQIQYLQEGLGSITEILLHNRETRFLNKYEIHNRGNAYLSKLNGMAVTVPRILMELFAIIGLVLLVLVMLLGEKEFIEILPILGLFAFAAFRLMPSFNRIMYNIQSYRYTLPALDKLNVELDMLITSEKTFEGSLQSFKKELELKHVSYYYPGSEDLQLRDVSIIIPNGKSIGFVGGSGAGKTTLIKIILGLLTPVEGKVLIDGTNLQSCLKDWQKKIGYVPQDIFLTDDNLKSNIAFGIPDDQIDDDLVMDAIKAAQLDEYVKNLPKGLNSFVGERGVRLSGGQLQRIGIARALYHKPKVLVLDEATSSLDIKTEQKVMNFVTNIQDKTLIIISHRYSTVQNCDISYNLINGRIDGILSYADLQKQKNKSLA